jgi:rhomboid protease GluP
VGTTLFAVVMLACAALYFLKPDERRRLALAGVARAKDAIRTAREQGEPYDALHALMQTRTRRPLAALALLGVCVWVWMGSAFSGEPAPQWMITAGASYAPRTTNGEWWRLAASTFVHAGFFHLLTTALALLSLWLVLERIVGSIVFVTVFVAAGVVASTIGLWMLPATTPVFGPSAAILGLYGLLVAAFVYGYTRQPRMPFSSLALRRIAVGAVPFLMYSLLTDYVPLVCALAGLATGMVVGLIATRGIVVRKPALAPAVLVPAAFAIVALLAALPLRGMIDARPEIARIADLETRTATEYGKAVAAFTQGRLSAKALVQVIDKTIIPALQSDRARVEALHGVPLEQRPLVAAARDYFKLREDSWRRRQAGLLASSNKMLREADVKERAAITALDRIQEFLRVG